MPVFAALCVFVFVTVAAWAAFEPMPDDEQPPTLWWAFVVWLLGRPLQRLYASRSEEQLARLDAALDLAGLRESLAPRTYLAGRLAFTMLAAALALGSVAAMSAGPEPVGAVVLMVLAAAIAWNGLAVGVWLQKRRRIVQMERELPVLLNLLAMSERAGADLTVALERAHAHLGSTEIRHEVSKVLQEVRLGSPVEEALRQMAERTQVEGATGLASAALQARKVGSDVGPWLQTLADQCWNSWVHKRREKALRAPIWLVLPMVLFLLPALGYLIMGPAVIKGVEALTESGNY